MRQFIYKLIANVSNGLNKKNHAKKTIPSSSSLQQILWKPDQSYYEYDNVNHYSFHSSKFIQSTFTKEGERFIKMNPPHTMMQQKLKDILTGFFGMRHVDAASLLQINKMFVLDSITLLNLLKIQDDDDNQTNKTTMSTVNNNKNNINNSTTSSSSINFNTVLDVGAGDGYVTQVAYYPLFKNIEVTEASAGCIESLKNNPFITNVHFETSLKKFITTTSANINDKKMNTIDLISMLNVLDRCDKPLTMLKDAHACLQNSNGKLIIALTYPHRPFVVEKDVLKAEQAETFDKLDIQTTFEEFIDKTIEHLNNLNFNVNAFSRVPYICVGSENQNDDPYSCLSCALFVCSVK